MSAEENTESALYQRRIKERERQKKAEKVRFSLDKYHEELGGLFDIKVTYHCMPRKTGKTEKAKSIFRNYFGGGDSIFVQVEEYKRDAPLSVTVSETGPLRARIGSNVDVSKLASFGGYGLVVVDDVHLLSSDRGRRLVVAIRQNKIPTQLVCFGTSADYFGRTYSGSTTLTEIADEVVYDSSYCHSCMQAGKTSFTKKIFDHYVYHDGDCLIDDDNTAFVERDLCHDCKDYDGEED